MRKRGWGSAWLILSIPIVLLLAAVPPAHADISDGGGRLVEIQSDNGTWDFIVTGRTAGDADGDENITGVTGLGLLAAFDETDNEAFLDAAVSTGNHLLEVFRLNPTSRPFPQDIEFLAALGDVSDLDREDRDAFEEAAEDWFENLRREFPRARDLIEHFIEVRGTRKALTLWDAASVIRAARAVGNRRYARQVAALAVSRSITREVEDTVDNGPADQSFRDTLMSRGSMLFALRRIGGGFTGSILRFRTFLVQNRESDGSWMEDTQVTAYALLGLSAFGRGRVGRVRISDAIEEGVGFLESMQLTTEPNGGFRSLLLTQEEKNAGFVEEEVSQVDSEAIQALAESGIADKRARKTASVSSGSGIGSSGLSPATPAK
ncbi:MAG: hypothetical protein HYY20_08645 [Candidatus Tectomicrobia bacterium]|uniref:HEAT repeat domain-containing protein n=1 Tax=Tectimicrobiota bacterium TaxID=2528274 RepID=A0A932CPU4_UNCTE|nr:hypothetical protein [Candidatus Tectomicrobia bacterium]